MITCDEFVIVEVVRQMLSKLDVVPQTMLPLSSFGKDQKRLKVEKRLFKT